MKYVIPNDIRVAAKEAKIRFKRGELYYYPQSDEQDDKVSVFLNKLRDLGYEGGVKYGSTEYEFKLYKDVWCVHGSHRFGIGYSALFGFHKENRPK